MLAAEFAAETPRGLRKLVVSNSPASMETWRVRIEGLRKKLPREVRETLEECEREGVSKARGMRVRWRCL